MTTVSVPMGDVKVMIAIPAGRDFDPMTVMSLFCTGAACRERGITMQLEMVMGSSIVSWARDELIESFLASACNVLFLIDSDMVWKPEQFIRLLVLSQLYPVVCAPYPAKKDPPTFFIKYDEANPPKPGELGLMEIHGTGLGFAAVRREVIEALVAKAPRVVNDVTGREMAEVHRLDSVHNGDRRSRRGEDIAFFADIREAGYKVMLDPSIILGHVGRKVYSGSLLEAMQFK